MFTKIKNYLIVFGGGILAGILLFFKFTSSEDQNDALEDAKLETQDEILGDEIGEAESELEGLEVDDLSPDEVQDYWENIE